MRKVCVCVETIGMRKVCVCVCVCVRVRVCVCVWRRSAPTGLSHGLRKDEEDRRGSRRYN